MFAILIVERPPLSWKDLLPALAAWARDAGGFAAVALLLWGLSQLIRWLTTPAQSPETEAPGQKLLARLVGLAAFGSAILYAHFLILLLSQGTLPYEIVESGRTQKSWKFTETQLTSLAIAGALALAAVLLPVLFGLVRLRWRRIWAISRLSIKETVRQKVLWVFSALLLIVLFASWFIDSGKPEFQLRRYVWVVDGATSLLLLLAASLLAAFSIPADVRSQTIHTVVTKPVERFEIVLGRVLGYVALMSVVLLVVTGLSLIYLLRGITPEAKEENYKARVPIYGTMEFRGTAGEDVGQEGDHRKYIRGPARPPEPPVPFNYAIWSFQDLSSELTKRPEGVTCEFAFDIYRTWKGPKSDEAKGIFCTFLVVTEGCPVQPRSNGKMEILNRTAIARRAKELKDPKLGPPLLARLQPENPDRDAAIADQLADEFGFFEVPSQSVTNNHTQRITLPAGLFRNALKAHQEQDGSAEDEIPALRIIVSVNDKSQGQRVGVNPYDLYLLDRERPFEWNFVKGAGGLWCRLCVVIAVAVACSTYLSGVISWICTMFLYVLGIFKASIHLLAMGGTYSKGPMEVFIEMSKGTLKAQQLQHTPTGQVASFFDEVFRGVLHFILKLIPDVNRLDLSGYVANGFDIGEVPVLVLDNLLPMLAYVLPWLVLAYYLIKYREIANPT